MKSTIELESVRRLFIDFIAATGKLLTDVQRQKPGKVMIGPYYIEYADLYAFFHQARDIFAENTYDFIERRSNPRILDCGSHVGLASIFFALRFPEAQIDAYESDPIIAKQCQANLEAFSLQRPKVHQAALWVHDRGVSFSSRGDASGFVGEPETRSVQVPSVRLRDLLEDQTVDLLKMDIEGAEWEIIPDCAQALANVQCLIVEIHAIRGSRELGRILSVLDAAGMRYVFSSLKPASWFSSQEVPPFPCHRTQNYLITVFAWH